MISNINYDKESEKRNQLRKEMATNYRIVQALREEKEEEERKKKEKKMKVQIIFLQKIKK